MLDIAYSSGKFPSIFLKVGWDGLGIDASDDVIYAKERELKVIKCDVSQGLPFKSERFALVFAGEIIEHILDTGLFASEINRVLVKRGKLVITTPNLASLENRTKLLFGVYPMWMHYKVRGVGHIRYANPKSP